MSSDVVSTQRNFKLASLEDSYMAQKPLITLKKRFFYHLKYLLEKKILEKQCQWFIKCKAEYDNDN